jgi:hypothetical protein
MNLAMLCGDECQQNEQNETWFHDGFHGTMIQKMNIPLVLAKMGDQKSMTLK